MRKYLEWVGAGTILALIFALFSYAQKVEHRITVVEQQEITNTDLLKRINDNMVTKEYLDAKLENVVKK